MQDNPKNGEGGAVNSLAQEERSRAPQLFEKIRELLGPWTEPVLLAYGDHSRHRDDPASFEKLLRTCCEAAQHVTQATGAAIALLEGAHLVYRMNAGEVTHATGTQIGLESGFPAGCTRTRQPFLSNRVLVDFRVDPALRQSGITAVLVIPILENGSALGFIQVCSRLEIFNVKHVLSLQCIAIFLSEALADLPASRRDIQPTGVETNNTETQETQQLSGNTSSADPVDEKSSMPQATDSPALTDTSSIPAVSLARPTAMSELPSDPNNNVEAAGSTFGPERRARSRLILDSLAYVSLGEENGGMLRDINDAGFSMQTALPLDPAAVTQRRARFIGNGDLEVGCELVWEREGEAGFRFLHISADLRERLHAWIGHLSLEQTIEQTIVASGQSMKNDYSWARWRPIALALIFILTASLSNQKELNKSSMQITDVQISRATPDAAIARPQSAVDRQGVVPAHDEVQRLDVNGIVYQAEPKNAGTQPEIAEQHVNGAGISQNSGETMQSLVEAAENGSAGAQWKLGLGYLKGSGVPQNAQEAAKWFKRAANQGYIEAQNALSDLYFSGQGVQKDYVRAYTWASIAAAASGNETDQLRRLRSQMTVLQMEDAQRKVSSWWGRHSDGAGSQDIQR